MKFRFLMSLLIFTTTNAFAEPIPVGSAEITHSHYNASINLDGIYQSRPNQTFLLTCNIEAKSPLGNTLFLRSYYPPQNIVINYDSVENCNGKVCSATWLQPGNSNYYTYSDIATDAKGASISFSVIDFPKDIDIKIVCEAEPLH